MGKRRTERLGDGNRSSSPDPALQSGWGHFSLGYGRGLTGHRAAQWMDIYITLAGLFDESVFWTNNGGSWSKKLEDRLFFFEFPIFLINLVMCDGSYLIGGKHKFWISMLKINKQKPQFNRLGRPAGGALRTCKPDRAQQKEEWVLFLPGKDQPMKSRGFFLNQSLPNFLFPSVRALSSPCCAGDSHMAGLLWLCCAVLSCFSCVRLCDSIAYGPPGTSVHGDSLGKNVGVGCRGLFQSIYPTQGSNPGLLHCRWILYHKRHQGSLNFNSLLIPNKLVFAR